jgi:hypothetical protein
VTRLLVGAVLLALVALYLRGLAGRLDRLHVRVEAARDALDAALVRRTAAALELAHSALLDPATSVLLAEEAYHAQVADDQDRELAESELTTALLAALPDDETIAEVAGNGRGDSLLDALRVACGRVVLARRFYNDTVRLTRALRDRRLVRALRLAGTAAYPEAFVMEDDPPPALGAVGGAGQVS